MLLHSHFGAEIGSIHGTCCRPYVKQAKQWLKEHDSLWLEEKQPFLYNMKRIQSDVFVMGCQPGDKRCNEDESHRVVMFSRDFYLGTTEVTQDLYEHITGKPASRFRGVALSRGKHRFFEWQIF